MVDDVLLQRGPIGVSLPLGGLRQRATLPPRAMELPLGELPLRPRLGEQITEEESVTSALD